MTAKPDRANWPALCGLVLGTTLITSSTPTSFAFDKVVHTGIATLACSGLAVLGYSRWLSHKNTRWHQNEQNQTLAVPLNEVGVPHPSREPSPCPQEDETYASSPRKLRILFFVLVAALCLRVEIFREVFRNIQCSAKEHWSLLIPVALAAWDWWAVQRKRRYALSDDADFSAYEALEHAVVRAPYTYLVAAALACAGQLVAISSLQAPASTYICAAVLPYRWIIPLLQFVGAALDLAIVICTSDLMTRQSIHGSRRVSTRFASVGKAMIGSACVLLVIGIFYFAITENDRRWILTIPDQYFWSVFKLNFYIAFTLICALNIVAQVGALTTTLVVAFTSVLTNSTICVWTTGHPFPPQRFGLAYLGISLATLSVAAFIHFQSLDPRLNGMRQALFHRVPTVIYLAVFVLGIFWTHMTATSKFEVNYHPIDLLIYNAHQQHEAYLNQSSASTTLSDAVSEYRTRYDRLPPPNFDKWFEYAEQRNSTVMDDFDSIHRDLLPYWILSPAEIRERTWELIANPWNDAAGIMIRDGKVSVIPNMPGTHRWMSDGLVDMISNFAEWLPDMDLAFNSNDEARVAVPYEEMREIRNIVDESIELIPQTNEFSRDRSETWKTVAEEPFESSPLQEISWQQTFHRFGNVACPPGSPARKQRIWDWSKLCVSCTSPQSLGAFLAKWSIAGDICHQPDLAELHGMYTSPAAFKGTHELYPIFSQSKPHGFNDILYPSAWNYMDKVRYDPTDEHPDEPFSQKESTLFWRGATSEGISTGRGQWQGMTRQRFIHLANDINGTSQPQSILLPSSDGRLRYQSLPVSELATLLPTDVHIVDSIARCAAEDCSNQHNEFSPLAEPTDFQSHWKYKYLLDLDGAGFSGRFLPFLRSKSLPFKAALVREWWDDRVTPWMHFVPLDLRGQGFWGTLAYFHGVRGQVNGREVLVDAHARDAERIAMQGKRWAEEVLRKEDMEIYMFRLLLEWGRLTDDNREGIGFEG